MTNALRLLDWLAVIRDEYMCGLIKDGGSSIKFAVPTSSLTIGDVMSEVAQLSEDNGYLVTTLDASLTRVHVTEEIFFQISSQVPWRRMAKQVVLRMAEQLQFDVRGISIDADTSLVGAIATVNSLSSQMVIQQLRPSLEQEVFVNHQMAKDFRVAMTRLCWAEILDASDEHAHSPIVDWLTGANRRISSVSPYSIYNAITRTNARYLLQSLLQWTRFVGYSGVVTIVDDSRITVPQNPRDGLHYYTRPMLMDHYELLREFIDGTDRLEGFLMIVLAHEEFLNDGHLRADRGLGIYQALRGRIANEVRSRNQANPMSALVELSAGDYSEVRTC